MLPCSLFNPQAIEGDKCCTRLPGTLFLPSWEPEIFIRLPSPHKVTAASQVLDFHPH